MLRSDLGLRVLAVLMGVALLIVVRGERRASKAFSVPVETRPPAGLEPAVPLPKTLTVAISGPWARLRSLDPDELGSVTLDYDRTSPGLATWFARPESLQVPAAFHIDSFHPSQGAVELRVVGR